MKLHRIFTVTAIVAVCGLPLRMADAAIVVLGGGLAQACYEHARAVADGIPYMGMPVITGTRVTSDPAEICSLALSGEEMTARDRSGTHNNRGVILFNSGEFEAALRDFTAAINFDDSIGESHVNRGATLVALKQWADSIAPLSKGLELTTAEPEKAYYNRAIAHEELGDVRAAYYDYLKAAELKPDWEQPKMQLTRFQVKKKADG